jgi:hypothetical protein
LGASDLLFSAAAFSFFLTAEPEYPDEVTLEGLPN